MFCSGRFHFSDNDAYTLSLLCLRTCLPTSKWACPCVEYSQWTPKGSWSWSRPKAIKHRKYGSIAEVIVCSGQLFLSHRCLLFPLLLFRFTDTAGSVSWWSTFSLYEVHNTTPPSAAQSSAPSVTGGSRSLRCVLRSCCNLNWCECFSKILEIRLTEQLRLYALAYIIDSFVIVSF